METWQKIILCAGFLGFTTGWFVIPPVFLQGPIVPHAPEPIVVQQAANWTSVIMALVVGLPASISAVVGGMALLQSRRNAEIAARTDAKVEVTSGKADTIIEKATEIHTLTNSNLSKVQAQLDVAQKTIEGLNAAQVESTRQMTSMQQMITSLIPAKDKPSPSQINGEKLDNIKAMLSDQGTRLSDVQHGNPPIPVHDEAVLKKLDDVVIGKLDTIQESADVAAQQTKDKAADEK